MNILLLAGLAALAESALGLGLVLPGETTIVAIASMTTMGLVPLIAAVAVGATLGDHIGYFLGRRFGPRLEHTRLIGWTGAERWKRAADILERHGVVALLVSRMLPIVRTVMPAAAGAAGLAYYRFVVASVVGSLLWASLWVTAGSALRTLGQLLGTTMLGVLAAAAVLTALVLRARRVQPR